MYNTVLVILLPPFCEETHSSHTSVCLTHSTYSVCSTVRAENSAIRPTNVTSQVTYIRNYYVTFLHMGRGLHARFSCQKHGTFTWITIKISAEGENIWRTSGVLEYSHTLSLLIVKWMTAHHGLQVNNDVKCYLLKWCVPLYCQVLWKWRRHSTSHSSSWFTTFNE